MIRQAARRPDVPYALQIGLRYLRSKKRSTVSVITLIAVGGVALGVAALLSVLSITTGFQKEFRDKVLGVNAHVLVLKYGLDFDEYRDVVARAERMPEVLQAAPFVINEMMLAKDDRLSGVLVKGVDPERMQKVLDLPQQIVDGSLSGLRRPGSSPPLRPDDLEGTPVEGELDEVLQELLAPSGSDEPSGSASQGPSPEDEALIDRIVKNDGRPLVDEDEMGGAEAPRAAAVLSPEEAERALEGELPDFELPDEEWEARILEEEILALEEAEGGSQSLPGIVVGATLARNLGLGVGDRVKVVSPLTGIDASMWAPEARTPRSRDFRVTAIFEAGFQEYDSRLVYVDIHEAQRFYDHGDSVTGVEMRLHDLERSRDVAKRLERELGGPFHTMDWAELNHNLFTALEIQKIMLSLVIASIIIVAAFNVVATLIMIVLEKKREIAILKAMGSTDGSILGIFLVQGAVIGVVGTAIGLLLGGGIVAYLSTYQLALDPKVYLIDHLPVVVRPAEFLITVVVALLICLGATLIPSWWAARLLPADGVRYE